MPRLNPNKPLRTALIAALSAIGIPVKSKLFPVDTTPGKQYILITTQTKQRTAISKECYDYQVQTVIDINCINSSGVSNATPADDIEEQAVQIIEDGLSIAGFTVKATNFIQSLDLDVSTPNYYINRRVVTYQHWLGQLPTT